MIGGRAREGPVSPAGRAVASLAGALRRRAGEVVSRARGAAPAGAIALLASRCRPGRFAGRALGAAAAIAVALLAVPAADAAAGSTTLPAGRRPAPESPLARSGSPGSRPATSALAPAPTHEGAPARPAPAADADPDTALDEYLDEMRDSTDAYFGLSAAERDTAGLDSALAYGLEHPEEEPRPPLSFSVLPVFGFNRVDGPVWGLGGSLGEPRGRFGRLEADARYAAGPNVWLGGGGLRQAWRRRGTTWSARVHGSRRTAHLDRERGGGNLATLRALVAGSDHAHYFRREGLEVQAQREGLASRVALGYRDMLESPLATTTTWNLTGRAISEPGNLAAARGRARELAAEAVARLPRLPVTVEIRHANAGGWSNSDFSYRRTRVAAAADLGLGAFATLVPQVAYGRLSGDAIPQASFYLGGAHSLRSIRSGTRGGTGLALARLDLIGADDVLALARIPHPSAFPLQAGLFAATGAVWGPDPFGPTRPGERWPRAADWVHEAGVSLLYQPGIPDPLTFLRASYAWALGPGRDGGRFSISVTRAIDVLKPLDAGD